MGFNSGFKGLIPQPWELTHTGFSNSTLTA